MRMDIRPAGLMAAVGIAEDMHSEGHTHPDMRLDAHGKDMGHRLP
jgi:hypothetical protein